MDTNKPITIVSLFSGCGGMDLGFLVDFLPFSCYYFFMTITQTVEVPASRRITLDVPREITSESVILTFTPAENSSPAETERKRVPVFGCAKGQFKMTEDFDAPLEDFKDYM